MFLATQYVPIAYIPLGYYLFFIITSVPCTDNNINDQAAVEQVGGCRCAVNVNLSVGELKQCVR